MLSQISRSMLFILCLNLSINVFSNSELQTYIDLEKDNSEYLNGEFIDGYMGTVVWRVKEVTLPGDNGLDIDIIRKFDPFVHSNLVNWKIEVPQFKFNYSPKTFSCSGKDSNERCDFIMPNSLPGLVIEFPGKAPIVMPSLKTIRTNNDDYPDGTIWIAKGGWYGKLVHYNVDTNEIIDANLDLITYNIDNFSKTIAVYSPNGKRYLFSPSGDDVNYLAFRVDDNNGNYIKYNYVDPLQVTFNSSTAPVYKSARISSIESNDGRNVEFVYGDIRLGLNFPVLEKIVVTDTQHGSRIWEFEYGLSPDKRNCSYYGWDRFDWDDRQQINSCSHYIADIKDNEAVNLKKVTMPNLETTEYTYSKGKKQSAYTDRGVYLSSFDGGGTFVGDIEYLDTVKFSTGLKLDYDYELSDFTLKTGGVGILKLNALSKRTLTGTDLSNAVWNYYHTEDALEHTVKVNGPLHRKKQSYLITEAATNPLQGKLINSSVYDLKDVDFQSAINTNEYEYGTADDVGGFTGMFAKYNAPVYIKKITVDDKYITEFSDFDNYLNPKIVTKKTGNKTRVTKFTYYNSKIEGGSTWLVGLVKTETVEGHNDESWKYANAYNEKGQLIQSDNQGLVEKFTYHANGNLNTHTYFQNANTPIVSTYTDYFRGTPQKEVLPEGVVLERKVNDAGTIAWEKDGEGHITSYDYDKLNRVTSITPPSLKASNIAYLPNQVTVTKAGTGYEKKVTLDALGRPVLVKESGNGITPVYVNTQYDAAGNETFISLPSYSSAEAYGVRKTYDGLGRTLSVTEIASGASKTYCYGLSCYNGRLTERALIKVCPEHSPDPLARCTLEPLGAYIGEEYIDDLYSVTDGRNNTIYYKKEIFGHPDDGLIRVIEQPEGITTLMDRNYVGDITSVTQGGVTRSYNYFPGTSRLYTIVEPERGIVTLTYDDAGNTKTRKVGSMPLITYTYDDLNRLDYVDYLDGTADIDYDYDKNNNLKTVTNGSVKRVYNYTSFNGLDNESLLIDGQSFTLDYGYNNIGQLDYFKYPSGIEIDYSLDDFGRATQVGNYALNVGYHENSQLSDLIYGNGVAVTFSQNDRQMLERIEAKGSHFNPVDMKFFYDKLGDVSSITDFNNTLNNIALTYDGVNRVATASGRWGAGSFKYDGTGNVKSKNLGSLGSLIYNYDASNRLDNITGSHPYNFSYDDFGNVTGNGKHEFTFDAASRMTKVRTLDSPPQTLIDYTYDADGIKVKEVKSGRTTYTVYSQGGNLLYEKDISNGRESSFIRLAGRNIAKVDTSCASIDSDNDGLNDCIELQNGLDPENSSDASEDKDQDGLTNAQELNIGASIHTEDSDYDGMPDGFEFENGLNLFFDDSLADTDEDGFTNIEEYENGTSPLDPLNVPLTAMLIPIFYLLLN